MAGCSYPPGQLKEALEAHRWMLRHNGPGYNEMVVDLRSVSGALPFSVEGFFCLASANAAQRADLREIQRRFLRDFWRELGDGTGAGRTSVLVELDLKRTDAPFRPLPEG
jgi:hypothetical protein